MKTLDKQKTIQLAQAVIKEEANAVLGLCDRINDHFVSACQLLMNCPGRIVVLGIGKSGHIGRKIAATLASTGSPSFFISAAEAAHGDMGMIDKQDVAILLSNSGQSDELIALIPPLKRLGIKLISLTGNTTSSLAENSDITLDTSVTNEACPLGLAPTTSTTTMLAMGDALAVALLDARGFNESDFARSHPAGRLGKRLLIKVSDIMHSGNDIPRVQYNMTLEQGLLEMTSKGLGMTVVTDELNQLLGIFTDGDLRRVFEKDINIHSAIMKDVMTSSCHTAKEDQLAVEILEVMQNLRINSMPVTNQDNQLIGALNMHDLLKAGVI